VGDAAKRLRELGSVETIAAALDDWTYARKRLHRNEDAEHLSDIACAADPDDARTRLRKAILIGDRQLLREVARDRDLRALPASGPGASSCCRPRSGASPPPRRRSPPSRSRASPIPTT